MLKRLLSRKSKKSTPSAISTLEKLHETLEMLEKKERVLQKKIATEIDKAKDYTKSKNKNAAIQCLKKKRLYESHMEQLGISQLRVHDQIILLEGAKVTTDTVDALRSGASSVKSIQQSLSIDDIDRTMEELTELTENMKQIQDVLAAPVGAAADFDEDELEAELEELELLDGEEQLPIPPHGIPTIPDGERPLTIATPQPNDDMEQLTTHQAEIVL